MKNAISVSFFAAWIVCDSLCERLDKGHILERFRSDFDRIHDFEKSWNMAPVLVPGYFSMLWGTNTINISTQEPSQTDLIGDFDGLQPAGFGCDLPYNQLSEANCFTTGTGVQNRWAPFSESRPYRDERVSKSI